MYTIQHNPVRLYKCDKTGITIVQHKHMKTFGLKGVGYLLFKPQNRDLLWQLSAVWVQMDNSVLHYLYFQENIWNKNWWMAHRLDQSMCAIPWGGYRARFSPSGFCISSNIQNRQKRSCYLGTERALFTHKELGGHYFSSRESCWHHLSPTSQQSQNVPLDKDFMEPLKTFYSQETEI
jgi:hypothetical protein